MAAQESQLLAREHAYMVERNQHLAVIQISQARIASFEASISWKVTAPLRQVKRWGQLCRRLIRRRHCDLRAVPAADVPNALRPVGESLHWFDLVPNGGGLPTGWALVSLTADVEGTTVYPILAIYYGVGDWRPMSLPPVVGTLEDHILRLPDHVGGLMLAFVFADSRPVPKPPKLRLVEVGQIEVGLRTVSRHRHRLRGALHFLRIHGYRAALARAANIHLPKDFDAYERWIAVYDSLSPDDVDAIEAHIEALPSKPTISVVVPVYNTEESHLRQMIDSVLTQIYPHWELCIADDASTAPHVREVLADYERRDSRIKVVLRQRNGHISAASNSALELVSGPYVALLDHDDVLTPHALYLAAVAVNEHPDADIVYSDEDKIDGNGRRYGPYFKPDWNFELLLGQNYVSHFGVYRTSAVREVGGFRLGYEGSQDYDLVLRIAGRTRGPIVHVPFVLYHWRIFSGATTFSSKQFETATMAARRALADYFASRGEKVEVKPAIGGFHKVVYKLPEILPEVSVIVPTRDQADLVKICVRGVVQGTDYPNLEVIVVNNDSREDDALSYFAELRSDTRVRVVDYPGEFNYSGINNTAAREAAGDILVFLNNDIEVVSSDWLKEMVRLAVRPAIGAVGAKLLYHDKTVQHGGIVLGLGGIAGHLYDGYAQEETGYLGRLHLRQGMSCVSAACLAMRKSVFDEVGGFDEENLKVAYNDVDLCLKIGEKGYQVVWTPEAQLLHWGSKSRGSDRRSRHADRRDKEVEHMWSRWGDKLKHDPLFSPNLSLTSPYPDLAFPPRRSKPWAAYLPKVPNPSLPTLKI
jgi:GT2 family glycosyltransferase